MIGKEHKSKVLNYSVARTNKTNYRYEYDKYKYTHVGNRKIEEKEACQC